MAQGWQAAIAAADQGLEATKSMQPHAGRGSYPGDRATGIPDGGGRRHLTADAWMKT
nr:DAK2 domain-containing protein [Paracoccus sp. S1E-3]